MNSAGFQRNTSSGRHKVFPDVSVWSAPLTGQPRATEQWGTAADVRLSVLVGVVLLPATCLHQNPSEGGHVASA